MHPFVDIYSTECNKGMAFDTIIAELAYASANGKGTLYLGDSKMTILLSEKLEFP